MWSNVNKTTTTKIFLSNSQSNKSFLWPSVSKLNCCQFAQTNKKCLQKFGCWYLHVSSEETHLETHLSTGQDDPTDTTASCSWNAPGTRDDKVNTCTDVDTCHHVWYWPRYRPDTWPRTKIGGDGCSVPTRRCRYWPATPRSFRSTPSRSRCTEIFFKLKTIKYFLLNIYVFRFLMK